MATKAMQLKQKIHERKEIVVGMFCYMMDPIAVEYVATTKLVDFIIVELEHTPFYADKALELIRAAEAYDIIPLVRVPETDRIIIQKVLDIGAKGIMLPQIRNAEEVKHAIACTKYAPEGIRGMANIVRGTGYTPFEKWTKEKVQELNDELMVFILPLENLEAINNIEEILSVPGIDCSSLSIADITHALDRIGEWDHPDVRAVQDKALGICNDKKIPTYTVPVRRGQFEFWYNKGVRVFTLVDYCLFEFGFTEFSSEFTHYLK